MSINDLKHKKPQTSACGFWFKIIKARREDSGLKFQQLSVYKQLAEPPQKRLGTRIPIGGHSEALSKDFAHQDGLGKRRVRNFVLLGKQHTFLFVKRLADARIYDRYE